MEKITISLLAMFFFGLFIAYIVYRIIKASPVSETIKQIAYLVEVAFVAAWSLNLFGIYHVAL